MTRKNARNTRTLKIESLDSRRMFAGLVGVDAIGPAETSPAADELAQVGSDNSEGDHSKAKDIAQAVLCDGWTDTMRQLCWVISHVTGEESDDRVDHKKLAALALLKASQSDDIPTTDEVKDMIEAALADESEQDNDVPYHTEDDSANDIFATLAEKRETLQSHIDNVDEYWSNFNNEDDGEELELSRPLSDR